MRSKRAEESLVIKHRATKVPAMTTERAVLLALMDRFLAGLLDPFISLLEIHKLMYFMQETGEPLQLRIIKGPYGPNAENLGGILHEIEGLFVSGYEVGDDAPDKIIELLPGAVEAARAALEPRPETQERFDQVGQLIEGFEPHFGLELLSTVHWVVTREGAASDDEVVARTYEWDERKKRFSRRQLLLARDVLEEQGWVTDA